jgi:hypothetical protein
MESRITRYSRQRSSASPAQLHPSPHTYLFARLAMSEISRRRAMMFKC